MGSLKLTNNAKSVLAGAFSNVATQLSVQAGDGAKFPALGAGDWFPLTLVNTSGAYEIVRATARAGDLITVARAQEGTAAQGFAPNDKVSLRLTAAAISSLIPNGVTLLSGNNLSDLANAATARLNLGLGDAATHAASDFATATQGAKADLAIPASSIATVGTSGSYNDLINKPDLTAYLTKAANLAGITNPATARANLGLGSVALFTAGNGGGQVPVLDGGGKLAASTLPDVVSSSALPVGFVGYMLIGADGLGSGSPAVGAGFSVPSVADGATIGGNFIYSLALSADPDTGSGVGRWISGAEQTGTWQNVSGVTIGGSAGSGGNSMGLFKRVA